MPPAFDLPARLRQLKARLFDAPLIKIWLLDGL